MNRPIAINLVRGILGALNRTPRGIDRIDFGYRAYLLEHWPENCFGVLPSPMGMRFIGRDLLASGHERLASIWKEDDAAHEDGAFLRLKASLDDPAHPDMAQRRGRRRLDLASYWRVVRLLLANGIQIGRPVHALPEGTVYLDVGHYGLGQPMFLNWLDRRPDISPVFLLHDAIPLEHPEMVAEKTVRGHARVLDMTAQHARAVIVPTNAAGVAIKAQIDRRGGRDIAIHPVPLPIDEIFLGAGGPDPDLMARPYFLICGAIEIRKNHAVLIDAWSQLVERFGAGAPRLIIAGSPGFGADDIIGRIAARTALRGHVLIASGLSTPAIARLMVGARALLMPSKAEGFGLPPVEALALGTPAILSDIAAHRDAAGEFGIYLGTADVGAWTAQISSMIEDTPDYLVWKARIQAFRPYDWPRYMAEISEILMQMP